MILDIYTDASVPYNTDVTKNDIKIGSIVVNQDDPNYKGYKFSKKTSINAFRSTFKGNLNVGKDKVLIAEMHSICETLKIVMKLDMNVDIINIYTDSMRSFDVCNGLNKKIKCGLVGKMSDFINVLKKKSGITINIMWIKAHAGTWGNEQADKLCKHYHPNTNEIHRILPK